MSKFDPKRNARIDLDKKKQKESKKIDFEEIEDYMVDENDYFEVNNKSWKKSV